MAAPGWTLKGEADIYGPVSPTEREPGWEIRPPGFFFRRHDVHEQVMEQVKKTVSTAKI